MKFHKVLITLLLVFCLAGCSKDVPPEIDTVVEATQVELIEDVESVVETEPVTEETESLEEIILPEANDEDFVRVKAYIPDIFVELRYSTENNFTGQKIYDFSDVWLRYGTVKKLILVQEELKEQGITHTTIETEDKDSKCIEHECTIIESNHHGHHHHHH